MYIFLTARVCTEAYVSQATLASPAKTIFKVINNNFHPHFTPKQTKKIVKKYSRDKRNYSQSLTKSNLAFPSQSVAVNKTTHLFFMFSLKFVKLRQILNICLIYGTPYNIFLCERFLSELAAARPLRENKFAAFSITYQQITALSF